MGYRLHVQTKHEIEYDNSAYFNWGMDKFKEILGWLSVNYYVLSSDEGCDESYEIEAWSFKEGIEQLENFDNLDKETQDAIKSSCEFLDYTLSELLEIFKRIYEVSSKTNGYMYLDWF